MSIINSVAWTFASMFLFPMLTKHVSGLIKTNESNDEERLDVDNGILLSPMIDSLFDRHLISFDDDGTLLISSKLSSKNIKKLNLLECPSISLNEGMLKYIKRHRKRFRDLENDKSNVYLPSKF